MIYQFSDSCKKYGVASFVASLCMPAIVPFVLFCISFVQFHRAEKRALVYNEDITAMDTADRGRAYALAGYILVLFRIAVLFYIGFQFLTRNSGVINQVMQQFGM